MNYITFRPDWQCRGRREKEREHEKIGNQCSNAGSNIKRSKALFARVRAPYNAVNEDGLRLVIKQIGEKAGLKRRVYPHLFRKTMATTLRIKDCAIEDIQQILGHKDASTTLGFYAAANGEHLRQVHNRYMSIGA